jgi:pilus assembly protein CpaE
VSAASRFADVIEDEEAREALARLLAERAPEALERALGSRTKPDATAHHARAITFLGSRGGVGTTTLAVNVAWLLAHETELKVALVDLDLRLGTVALSLDLEPTHGLREVLESPDRIDSLFVSSAMARESETLSVLSGEEPLGDRFHIDAHAFDALLTDLRANFDLVVIDLPRNGEISEDRVLAQSDKVVLVSDLSLAGMRDAVRLAAWARGVAGRAELSVVVNRAGAHAKAEVPRADFERGIEAKIAHILPYDPKAASAAASAGRPVAVAGKGSPFAKALRQASFTLAGTEKPARGKLSLSLFRRK